MKKYLLLLLVCALSIAVVGCNDSNDNTGDVNGTQVSENTTINKEAIEEKIDTYFANVAETEPEILNTVYGLDVELLEDYFIKVPIMNVKSNLYMIVKPLEENREEVEATLDEFFENYEMQWERYLQDQYELVINRTKEEVNGYLVYVISENNEEVMNAIKENL